MALITSMKRTTRRGIMYIDFPVFFTIRRPTGTYYFETEPYMVQVPSYEDLFGWFSIEGYGVQA